MTKGTCSRSYIEVVEAFTDMYRWNSANRYSILTHICPIVPNGHRGFYPCLGDCPVDGPKRKLAITDRSAVEGSHEELIKMRRCSMFELKSSSKLPRHSFLIFLYFLQAAVDTRERYTELPRQPHPSLMCHQRPRLKPVTCSHSQRANEHQAVLMTLQ